MDIQNLDKLLCDHELYDNPDKIVKLSKERENLQSDLDLLYNKWIKLTEN